MGLTLLVRNQGRAGQGGVGRRRERPGRGRACKFSRVCCWRTGMGPEGAPGKVEAGLREAEGMALPRGIIVRAGRTC